MAPQEMNFPVPSNASSKDEKKPGLVNDGFVLDELEHTEKTSRQDDLDEEINSRKDVDFDDLLPHVGEFGVYQRLLFVAMVPFAFFVSFVY